MTEMIVCPHCSKCIKFRLELINGTMPEIDQISRTTYEDMRPTLIATSLLRDLQKQSEGILDR